MYQIEANISPLIENLFPEFYRVEGQNFVAFIKAYYEWLEQNFQYIELVSTEGFSVGDIISQSQNDTTIATGSIYSIEENNFILVELSSFAPFRCELKCNILAPIVNEAGVSSRILDQYKVNPLFNARNIFKYRDVDNTIDQFILHFKEKYLKNIQFNTATNKNLLIKNSLDLYRSKGTERSIDLFFKLIYNKQAEVYYPGDDIFNTSSGDWYVPKYLEISSSLRAVDFVGKIITGMTSGATAFVEKFIRRKITTGYSYILYISNIVGEFQRGETLRSDIIHQDAPKVLGSLNTLEVTSRGSGYAVGDEVDIIDSSGAFGKARVTEITTSSGEVEFIFNDGGYGYSSAPIGYLSDKILTISNVVTTDSQYFRNFETFSQSLANIELSAISSNSISAGNTVYTYHGNGSLKSQGLVLESTISSVYNITVNTAANSTVGLTLTSGNTNNISIGDLVIGSTNTAVVNTNISAKVTDIVNSTAFTVNTDIIIANGTTSITTSSTGDVGELYIYVVSGTFETGQIYTTANAISGTISSITDKSISAVIIKEPEELVLSVINATGTLAVGDYLYQTDGSDVFAQGIISGSTLSGGVGTITVSNYTGIFDSDFGLIANTGGGTCNLSSFTTSLAIQYEVEKSVSVTVNTSANSTTLLVLSSGNTSGLQAGDKLLSSSNTSVVNTYTQSYISSVVNSTALVIDTDVVQSNGTALVTFEDITDIDFITNNSVFCVTSDSNTTFVIDSVSLGSDAEYSIVNVETSETVFVNTDTISGNNVSNLPFLSLPLNSSAFGFTKDPTANISSYIIQALSYSIMNIGTVTDVITANPGMDYTLAPEVAIVEPSILGLNLHDFILEIEEVPGSIKTGDIITQNTSNITQTILTVSNATPFISGETLYQGASLATSTANGIVYYTNTAVNTISLINTSGTFSNSANIVSHITSNTKSVSLVSIGNTTSAIAKGVVKQTILDSNSTILYVSRMSVPDFVPSGNVIISDINLTANILSVTEQTDSIPIGLNANVETNVIMSENSVSALKVVDSGFGYGNNLVTFVGTANQVSGEAIATVDGHGVGSGRYRNSKGFLSDNKFLFDGDYYQEYSYEILSSISFDKYSDMFKKVMHVAGTKVFGSISLQDEASVVLLNTDDSTITQS